MQRDPMPGNAFADGDSALAYFSAHALKHGFDLDPSQKRAVMAFEHLAGDLLAREKTRGLIARIARRPPRRIPGLYLWGGVGRGKSFMMDTFFAGVPVERKQRWHFHRFMLHVHDELKRHAGQVDPLRQIAQAFSAECQLLCLDEFHVTDITDAMLLRRLFERLFGHGVVLVTTSNCAPHQLYANGLQRSQFLPAIALLEQNLTVLNVDSGIDYRLRRLEMQPVYTVESDLAAAESRMLETFVSLARHEGSPEILVPLPQGRGISAHRHANGVVWFRFADLCGQTLGKADMVELARHYETVLISAVPQLVPEIADQAQRFVWMVDEFYDRHVKLVLAADVPVDQLCTEGRAAADFARTASRLIEMQSRKYLSLPHLP